MDDVQLTKSFKNTEMLCPCGECDGGKMDHAFMTLLQHLRDLCKFPFDIESGYRCEKHNAAIGGEEHSLHKLGKACDIRFADGAELYKLIKFAPLFFTGLGVNNGSVHVDSRGGPGIAFTYYKHYVKK